jgi:hypothetical protein
MKRFHKKAADNFKSNPQSFQIEEMIDLVMGNKNIVQIRKVLIKLLLNTKKLDKLKKRSSKTFK